MPPDHQRHSFRHPQGASTSGSTSSRFLLYETILPLSRRHPDDTVVISVSRHCAASAYAQARRARCQRPGSLERNFAPVAGHEVVKGKKAHKYSYPRMLPPEVPCGEGMAARPHRTRIGPHQAMSQGLSGPCALVRSRVVGACIVSGSPSSSELLRLSARRGSAATWGCWGCLPVRTVSCSRRTARWRLCRRSRCGHSAPAWRGCASARRSSGWAVRFLPSRGPVPCPPAASGR